MARTDGLRPWPSFRDTWWIFALAALALGLFLLGFLVDLRCGPGGCRRSVPARLLDIDAVGGVPRLFTTGLFLGVGLLAWQGARSVDGARATWWAAVAVTSGGLALAKSLSVHATVKDSMSPWLALAVGLVLAGGAIGALWVIGRRYGVAATAPVLTALTAYAGVALGLDLLTTVAAAVQDHVGWLTVSAATFVEELGEAMAALLLLVTVRWQAPTRGRRGGSGDRAATAGDQTFRRAR